MYSYLRYDLKYDPKSLMTNYFRQPSLEIHVYAYFLKFIFERSLLREHNYL